mmetsp:Transcript_10807/g.22875  ORF Transcript_10807/g.22875 Transcript_10807/m.22875 type:complete len:585 (+) Transcript_10807:1563-3317(+)
MPRHTQHTHRLGGTRPRTTSPRHLHPAVPPRHLLRNTPQPPLPHEMVPRLHTRPAALPRTHPQRTHALPLRHRQTTPGRHARGPQRRMHRRRPRQKSTQPRGQHPAPPLPPPTRPRQTPPPIGRQRRIRPPGGAQPEETRRHLRNGISSPPRSQIHGGCPVGKPPLSLRRGVFARLHSRTEEEELLERRRRSRTRDPRRCGRSERRPGADRDLERRAESEIAIPMGCRARGLPRDVLPFAAAVSKVSGLSLEAERGGVRGSRLSRAGVFGRAEGRREGVFGGVGGVADVRRFRHQEVVRERRVRHWVFRRGGGQVREESEFHCQHREECRNRRRRRRRKRRRPRGGRTRIGEARGQDSENVRGGVLGFVVVLLGGKEQRQGTPLVAEREGQTQTQDHRASGAERRWPSRSPRGKCHGGQSASQNGGSEGWLPRRRHRWRRRRRRRPRRIPAHPPLTERCRVHRLGQHVGISRQQSRQRSSVLPLPDLPRTFGPRTLWDSSSHVLGGFGGIRSATRKCGEVPSHVEQQGVGGCWRVGGSECQEEQYDYGTIGSGGEAGDVGSHHFHRLLHGFHRRRWKGPHGHVQ